MFKAFLGWSEDLHGAGYGLRAGGEIGLRSGDGVGFPGTQGRMIEEEMRGGARRCEGARWDTDGKQPSGTRRQGTGM